MEQGQSGSQTSFLGSLDGRVAVVIGGSMGFGEEVAARFVRDGARVVIAARNEHRLKETAEKLGAFPIPCDITRSDSVRALADRTLSEFGRLDVAVNSAGAQDRCLIADLEPERVESIVSVQFTGAIYFMQHMANAMVRSEPRGGSIINISSLTGTLVAEGYAPYAGAKAGVNHASRIAASEYGRQGVRVNIVSPTVIPTPMTEHLFAGTDMADAIIAETPLGRVGSIEDVVNAISFLASDASGFITGETIHIDGGTALRRLPRRDDANRRPMAAAAAQVEATS